MLFQNEMVIIDNVTIFTIKIFKTMILSRLLGLNYIPTNFFSECPLCAKTVKVSDSSSISPEIWLDGLRGVK